MLLGLLIILSGLSSQTTTLGCTWAAWPLPSLLLHITRWPQNRGLGALHYPHSQHRHQDLADLAVSKFLDYEIHQWSLFKHTQIHEYLLIYNFHTCTTISSGYKSIYFKNIWILTDLISPCHFFSLKNVFDKEPFSWGQFVCIVSINFNLQFLHRNLLKPLVHLLKLDVINYRLTELPICKLRYIAIGQRWWIMPFHLSSAEQPSKTSWLKTANIYYLVVSVHQKSGHRLARCTCLKVSQEAESVPRPQCHLKACWGGVGDRERGLSTSAPSCGGWQATVPCHMASPWTPYNTPQMCCNSRENPR